MPSGKISSSSFRSRHGRACRPPWSLHRSCAALMLRRKLSIGFWDHWVPAANGATEGGHQEWAEKEKVEVQIDFITSQGNKLLLTGAAESQAESRPRHAGARAMAAVALLGPARADERRHGAADQAERRGQRHGRVSRQARWQVARRSGDRRQPDQGPVLAHRLHEGSTPGIDVQAMYPAGSPPRPTPGRSIRFSRRRKPVTRAAIRSASDSARRATMSTPPGAFSMASKPCSSTPRATSP